MDYVQMVQAYSETFSYWENTFRSRNIDLVVNGTIEAAVVSRKIEIPFRGFASSRYKHFHFWAVNEFLEDPGIAPRLEAFRESAVEPITAPEPYYSPYGQSDCVHKERRGNCSDDPQSRNADSPACLLAITRICEGVQLLSKLENWLLLPYVGAFPTSL